MFKQANIDLALGAARDVFSSEKYTNTTFSEKFFGEPSLTRIASVISSSCFFKKFLDGIGESNTSLRT